MTLEDFHQHQPVEPATTFTPSRAVAMTVFAVALVVDLLLLSLVWTHVLDELPAGVQGLFLIVMLGSFLGGFMSWKADKISGRFVDQLDRVEKAQAELAGQRQPSAKSCACYAELGELRQTVASQGGALSTVERQISKAVAGAFDPATTATIRELNGRLH